MFIIPFKGIWHILPYRVTDHRDIIIIILGWAFASTFIHFVLPSKFGFDSTWYLGLAVFFGGIGLVLLGTR